MKELNYNPIINKSLFKILLHLAAWSFFFFLPFLSGMPIDNTHLILKFTSHTAILALFFYTNTLFLIPRFLKKGKVGVYIVLVLTCIGLIFFYYQLVDLLMHDDFRQMEHAARENPFKMRGGGGHRFFGPVFSAIFIFALSTSIKITNEWIINEKQKKEMENEKLISELSFLKSQVSPHFLFNTLNNIYSLSLSNSENTSDAILKLSHLLRYMLYESEDKMVSLEKEITYLQNYIDLQKMRITKDVVVSFSIKGDLKGKMIEPMLLIPFVENAFKHGINYSDKSIINIYIEVSENKLFMKVENSLHQKNKQNKGNSGIGLNNIIKRLELLYPNKHSLNIKQTDEKYIVELNMNINL
jgi:two-component system, LytTR family, sensor kinase